MFRNAAQIAADAIRQAVFDGRLLPGERLREARLAEDLGISRTPIREALLILQTEGMVEAEPKRGSVVRTYGAEEISDLYETRAVLEAHAAGLAAKRIAPEEVEQLHASCARFDDLLGEGGGVHPLVQENLTFHTTLFDAARSPSLFKVARSVTELPLVYRSYYWYTPHGKSIALHYHQQITRAVEEGDPIRAEAAMREHVLEARDLLLSHLKESESDTSASSPGAASLAGSAASRVS